MVLGIRFRPPLSVLEPLPRGLARMLKFIRFVTSRHGTLLLVRNVRWHVAVADVELLVEMGELPACILEEEFPV